jgi:thioesterase domain-containing protein
MKIAHRGTGLVLAAASLALGAGCVVEPGVSGEDAQADLGRSFADACDARIRDDHGPGFPGACAVSGFTRTVVDPDHDIVEYRVDVQIGPGEHDAIGLHRVVQEIAPFRPERSSTALMLVHGDAWPFHGAFLDRPGGDSFAVFLARSGVDVWGIDLRWTRVPTETADLSSMRSWGMERDAEDLGVALSIARLDRARTGGDDRPLKLLGWSRGGQLVYAYAAHEATLPGAQRHVDGIVPVDVYLKLDPSTPEGLAERDDACRRLAADLARQDDATAGSDRYVVDDGKAVAALGQQALDAPTEAHRQAALLVGEATYSLPGGAPPTPRFHYTGGTFDAEGNPTGLSYTDEARWFAAAAQAAPYEPLQVLIDAERAMCEEGASPIEPLSAIRVPVLYVGAGGGFGRTGLYTASLLGSLDHRSLVVSLAADPLHDDIFLSRDARASFWDGILDWLRTV